MVMAGDEAEATPNIPFVIPSAVEESLIFEHSAPLVPKLNLGTHLSSKLGFVWKLGCSRSFDLFALNRDRIFTRLDMVA